MDLIIVIRGMDMKSVIKHMVYYGICNTPLGVIHYGM